MSKKAQNLPDGKDKSPIPIGRLQSNLGIYVLSFIVVTILLLNIITIFSNL